MKVTTVAELLAMEDGQIPLAVKAKVKKVFEQNSGTNDRGPWSIQNLALVEPGGTGEIKAKVTDREPLPASLQGKVIFLVCTKSEKHGWVGLKVVEDTCKGKTSKILKVTPTAELSESEPSTEAPASAPAAPQAAATPASPKTPPPAVNASPSPATAPQAPVKTASPEDEAVATVLKVEKFLRRRTALWGRCIKATVDAAVAVDPAAAQDPDNYRANLCQLIVEETAKTLPTTLFISCDRAGMADAYPYKDVDRLIELAKAKTKRGAK